MRYLVLDVATAAIADADTYLDGAISAPSNYKTQEAIDKYISEKRAERIASAGLDLDLARVTGIAALGSRDHSTRSLPEPREAVRVCQTEDDECDALAALAVDLRSAHMIVTYGGLHFDLPLLMRRARYLGIDFPKINLDRYKSPHVDLCELLSDRNPQRRRPLGFYVKRLSWTDLHKPLSGAEEAQVPVTGRWDELAESLRHDVTATYRLAKWLGVINEIPA